MAITDARRLEGQLRGRVADIGRAVASAKPSSGGREILAAGGSSRAAARRDPRNRHPTEPTFLTVPHAPSLSVSRANDVALSARSSYSPAAVVIPLWTLPWQQARAKLYGRVGLSGARQSGLAFTADSVDLSAMAALLSESVPPVSGTLAAGGTVSGTMARPVANIAVQGADLIADDERLGQLTADVGFANDEVTLSRLVLDKPQPERNGRLSAMGAYNVEQQSYSFDVRSEDLRLLGVALPSGQRLRGDVELAGRGSGLWTSPAGTLSLASSSLEIDDAPGAGDAVSGPSGAAELGPVAIKASAADHQATL